MSEVPPVLFIIFRRPETTLRVFEAIRAAQPTRLFVAADGPRNGKEGEAELCQQTRAIIRGVDWPCEVVTRFQEENQGIKKGVAGAISWFFTQVDEGIILEDDCLPHPDFFPYCTALLERYRNDPRIFHIGGVNFQPKVRTQPGSYYFSRYNHVWGWATWRRAWEKYRPEFEGLEAFVHDADERQFWDSPLERRYWIRTFTATRTGRVVTWDYQWKYTLWVEGGLGITPESNLVVNVGFGDGATNTSDRQGNHKERALEPLAVLVPNDTVDRHIIADRYTFRHKYWGSVRARFQHRLHKLAKILRGRR